MKDQGPDTFDYPEDGFDSNARVVAAKFFYFESKARIYAARLKEAGIPSFISNANASTVIPLGEGGIGLHVKETDLKEALQIIRELDINDIREPANISFRDADKEDIAYERELKMGANQVFSPALMIALFLIIVLGILLLRSCFHHPGFSPSGLHNPLPEKKMSTQRTYQENKLMSGLAL